jgi:hypothetical protein
MADYGLWTATRRNIEGSDYGLPEVDKQKIPSRTEENNENISLDKIRVTNPFWVRTTNRNLQFIIDKIWIRWRKYIRRNNQVINNYTPCAIQSQQFPKYCFGTMPHKKHLITSKRVPQVVSLWFQHKPSHLYDAHAQAETFRNPKNWTVIWFTA